MWYKSVVAVVLAAVAQIGGTGVADASLLDIRIDFNDKQAAPTNWNLVANTADTTTVHSLTDFNSGGSTGVTLQFTDGIVKSGENQSSASTWSNSAAPWVDTTALYDYGVAYGSDLTGQIVLSGLDAGKTYSVEVLSVRIQGSVSMETRFEVNDALDDAGDEAWNSYSDGFVNNVFLKWSEVTPTNVANGKGEIVLDITAPSGTYAFLNGMRVAEVPEPSTWLSLLAGVVALSVWRWRRS